MFPIRMLALALTSLSLAPSLAFAAEPAADATAPFTHEFSRQRDIYKGRGDARLKGYVIDRTLASYAETLPASFARALETLGPQDRWMDIGAGEGKAILDYYGAGNDAIEAQSLVNRAAKASCVAISIEDRRTDEWHRTAAAVDEHKLRYLFGRTFGEYSAAELGQFQVVTDVIGGFSYTPNLARFTERALASLAPGGSFFTVLQDVHSEEGSNVPHYAGSPYLTEIIAPDGSKLKVCAWLKRIGCVQVTCELRTGFIPPIEVYHIRKTCEDVTVPALATVHYTAGTPPERRFLLTDPPLVPAEPKPINTPLHEGVATPLK